LFSLFQVFGLIGLNTSVNNLGFFYIFLNILLWDILLFFNLLWCRSVPADVPACEKAVPARAARVQLSLAGHAQL
jgi:hypothetical protein